MSVDEPPRTTEAGDAASVTLAGVPEARVNVTLAVAGEPIRLPLLAITLAMPAVADVTVTDATPAEFVTADDPDSVPKVVAKLTVTPETP